MKTFIRNTPVLIALVLLLLGVASCGKRGASGKPSMDLVMKQSGGETAAQVSSPPEQQSKDAKAKPSPSRQGKRKVKYYKSTMMAGETSAKPAKDSMGMDMVPVYENESASANASAIAVDAVTRQGESGYSWDATFQMHRINGYKAYTEPLKVSQLADPTTTIAI